MMIREKLHNAIAEALKNIGIEEAVFTLEHPTELSHGDYATNAAMASAKMLGKSPKEIATQLVEILDSRLRGNDGLVESVTIAGPGFINFTLSKNFFANAIPEIISADADFGKREMYNGKKILVEHSSPNLFKPFHIGHMMNNAIGESLVRLMKTSGAEVKTMSFPSDISLGVAKAIFVILQKQENGHLFKPHDIVLLGDAYVEGTRLYEENETIHARVKEIADNLYAQKDSEELRAFEACKRFNIEYFEQITKRLGSHFDSYIYESEAGIIGKKIVDDNTPSVFTQSEGAIVYVPDESKKNLNTAVFVNSQGNPTYEAKDLGLLDLKFERENPNLSLFVTDYQQIPHFDIVLDAAKKIYPEWAEKSIHIPHGRMSFKGQKMSSRLGGVPLVSEILEVVLSEVRERSADRNLSDEALDQIAIAAIKFSILRAKPGQNINFDPETSLSFEGDSGPYLQYTYARIQSLIEKASELGLHPDFHEHQEASDLEKLVYRLPEIVDHAIVEYSPNYIVTYLLEIAHAFNSFYSANKIVDAENPETSAHRLAIARAAQIVLRNGLDLLGIAAPDRM